MNALINSQNSAEIALNSSHNSRDFYDPSNEFIIVSDSSEFSACEIDEFFSDQELHESIGDRHSPFSDKPSRNNQEPSASDISVPLVSAKTYQPAESFLEKQPGGEFSVEEMLLQADKLLTGQRPVCPWEELAEQAPAVSPQHADFHPVRSPGFVTKRSLHHHDPVAETLEAPNLKFHFDAKSGLKRKHRHPPRRLKFLYDSAEFREIKVEEKKTHPPSLITAPTGKSHGKGNKGKPANKQQAGTLEGGKAKLAVPADKNVKKADKRKYSPAIPCSSPPTIPPKSIIVDDPPWRTDNKPTLLLNDRKAWLIEQNRQKQWFSLKNVTSPEEEPSGTRWLKWTANGERIVHSYNLHIVLKSPQTMQLFFVQKRKRYIITALRTFLLFAEQSTKMKLRLLAIPGLLRRLVQMINWHDRLIRRLAVMLLACLSELKMFVMLLKRVGYLKRLGWLMEKNGGDPESDVWLVLLVRNLSKKRRIQEQLLDMGWMDILLDKGALKEQEADVVKYTLQTLYFVAQWKKMQKYLLVKGIFTAVIDLIFSKYPYLQYLTLMLLQKLLKTRNTNAIYRFYKSDCLPPLIQFITDITQRKLFAIAIEILEHINQAPAIARKLHELQLYRIVMDIATETTYQNIDSMHIYALQLVTRAAEAEDERRVMHSLSYEDDLLTFLQSSCVKVQVAALKAIAMLSRRSINQKTFFNLGAHRIVLFIMQKAQPQVREWAFYTIAFLIFRNKQIAKNFLAKGLTELIHQTLVNQEYVDWRETEGNALLCAILLRKLPGVREQLEQCIAPLLPHWLVHENKRIRNYAAVSISLFVHNSRTRQFFEENNGYEALATAAALDRKKEFLQNLCFGLASMAVDEDSLWKLINAGSLCALFMLKNEADRVSQGYVGFVVHRLVSLDRSFRYLFVGRLESDERLPHGLHDQGIISIANSLRRIEYLLAQGLLGDRTVVYVSLPKKYRTPVCCLRPLSQTTPNFSCDHAGSMIATTASDNVLGLDRIERSLTQQDFCSPTPYNPLVPADKALTNLIKQTRHRALKVHDQLGRIQLLAEIVADQMGGSSTVMNDLECEVSISFVKRRIKSNCVPLGLIEKGNSLHRAMLFKVLADVSNLKVTLVRGQQQGRGWNEVEFDGGKYVVDLLYNIGSVLRTSSVLAKKYIMSTIILPESSGIASWSGFDKESVRPLRGVISLARQQLLLFANPVRCERFRSEKVIGSKGTADRKLRYFDFRRKGSTNAVFPRLRSFVKLLSDLHNKQKPTSVTERDSITAK